MRLRRYQLAGGLCVAFSAYLVAFFLIVGAGHVTYFHTGTGPRPPQFIMYVSSDSETVNQVAKYVFFPLIKCCEATGEFLYVTDASDFDMELAPLAPKLWAVLWH